MDQYHIVTWGSLVGITYRNNLQTMRDLFCRKCTNDSLRLKTTISCLFT